MSHQCLADAFAPAEAAFKSKVMAETWGHLAPRRNKRYNGRIVFAVGCFGSDPLNPTALECEFKDLDSSPWFYDSLMEFMQSFETEPGGIYLWKGTFRNYCFSGTLTKQTLRAAQ